MLLLDQGLPRSTTLHLRESGIDAVHVGDIGLANADDFKHGSLITVTEAGIRLRRLPLLR